MNPESPNLTRHTNTAPSDRRTLLAGMGGFAAGALLAGAKSAHAGPLTPPAGPVASTPGPEPRIAVNATNTPGNSSNTFRITQPGSYYLTGNITGEVGKNAIRIETSDVTLDLNGFAVLGVPGAGAGIVNNSAGRVRIFNGSIRGFSTGINLISAQGGIVLRDVCSAENAANGFSISNGSLIGCWAISNGSSGASLAGESSAIGCVSVGNGLSGFSGSDNALFERCIAADNTSHGFNANGNAAFFACEATGNASGFVAAAAATLRDCIAVDNRQSGISCIGTNAGGVITGCTCRFNLADGIVASNALLVRDNTLFRNTSAGIRVAGAGNRIEANNATGGALGIAVAGAGNIVLRNTCSGNTTNYSIAAGNAVAPIIQAVNNIAAINGNTYAGPFGTTDPHANFSY